MVYAVAILLISALTTVGLIAVWAATSPGNWFWRTMAFLGAMSPLLLIPAYEEAHRKPHYRCLAIVCRFRQKFRLFDGRYFIIGADL